MKLALLAVLLCSMPAAAQASAQAPPDPPRETAQEAPPAAPLSITLEAETGEPAMVVYFNRPITELRGQLFSRTPRERANIIVPVLDEIVSRGKPVRVSARPYQGVMAISVDDRDLLHLVPADVNVLAGETLEGKAEAAVARLQLALDEAAEFRNPRMLLWGAAQAIAMTAVFLGLLWAIVRGYRAVKNLVLSKAERGLQKISAGDRELLAASHVPEALAYTLRIVAVAFILFSTYSWLTFVLRRFPYTRPWGESLRAFLIARLTAFGTSFLNALPDLFTVLLIVLITRFAARLAKAFFDAAEQERAHVPGIYPETAQPTRRIVNALLWLFALVVSYPYLPGSDSDAFKGVSVFVGLVISLGSSGIVNQVMSGFTLTYSRALRVGDFVRIGDIEGVVVHIGALSTKVKTPRREDITIPNAVVVSSPTTNYSRFADTEGVYVPTSVTIGYDAPWRQVHALLLLAAERTSGIRRDPAPVVRQTSLQDFYVQYTLQVCLDEPHLRTATLGVLHANIQDAFNEYGVQIMSPNYEADPDGPKTVPREKWYAAPAAPSNAPAVTAGVAARADGA